MSRHTTGPSPGPPPGPPGPPVTATSPPSLPPSPSPLLTSLCWPGDCLTRPLFVQAPVKGQSRWPGAGRKSPSASITSAVPSWTVRPGPTPASTGRTPATPTPGDPPGCRTGRGELVSLTCSSNTITSYHARRDRSPVMGDFRNSFEAIAEFARRQQGRGGGGGFGGGGGGERRREDSRERDSK